MILKYILPLCFLFSANSGLKVNNFVTRTDVRKSTAFLCCEVWHHFAVAMSVGNGVSILMKHFLLKPESKWTGSYIGIGSCCQAK